MRYPSILTRRRTIPEAGWTIDTAFKSVAPSHRAINARGPPRPPGPSRPPPHPPTPTPAPAPAATMKAALAAVAVLALIVAAQGEWVAHPGRGRAPRAPPRAARPPARPLAAAGG
jgi:hypothetical protein